MKSVEIAPAAEADLADIVRYIAEDNPARAASFVEELIGKTAQVGEYPNRFPMRKDISPGLRVAVHGRYLIFFREMAERVRVVRVLHGARDITKAFE